MRKSVVFGFLLAALAGCYTPPPLPPIVIGHVSDKSRPDKAGQQQEQGIRLALHELNKDNALTEALGGRAIQVRHTDTRGSLEADEAEAVRLVSINRCVALFGGMNPPETAALDHAQVPLLTFEGQRVAGASNNVFYLGMAPASQGEALAKAVVEDEKIRRLALLIDERRVESAAVAESFTKTLTEARKKDGEKSVALLAVRFGKDSKWEEFMERIDSHAPQAILFAGAAADFNAWYRAYRREFFVAQPQLIFAGEDGGWKSFDLDPKWKAKVLLATAYPTEPGSEKMQAFRKAYQEAFHGEPDVQAALAYDGFRILAEALKRAAQPQLTQDRLRDELKATKDFEGLTGPLTVGTDRVVRRPLFVARWQDGALTNLKKLP